MPGVLGPRSNVGLHPDEVTIAEVLSKAGYRTSHVGKWHQGDIEQAYPHNQGFDYAEYSPYNGAIWAWQGDLDVINCTFTANSSNTGGVYYGYNAYTQQLANCILWNNRAGGGIDGERWGVDLEVARRSNVAAAEFTKTAGEAIVLSEDDPEAAANRVAWRKLMRWRKPLLTTFSDSDPITRGGKTLKRNGDPGCVGTRGNAHGGA